jgi:uncharacterized protein with HEPN domain
MSKHDDRVSAAQMLDHIREAVEMSRGRSRMDLDSDRKLNLSLVRLLEVTGEAANRLSEEFRSKHSEIPWLQIIGLRNRLIHGYDAIDLDIVWNIVHEDLPFLLEKLAAILKA